MSYIVEEISGDISYFALDLNADLTPDPYINEFDEFNLFSIDLMTGELTTNIDGDIDDFFELDENGDITPKILI